MVQGFVFVPQYAEPVPIACRARRRIDPVGRGVAGGRDDAAGRPGDGGCTVAVERQFNVADSRIKIGTEKRMEW